MCGSCNLRNKIPVVSACQKYNVLLQGCHQFSKNNVLEYQSDQETKRQARMNKTALHQLFQRPKLVQSYNSVDKEKQNTLTSSTKAICMNENKKQMDKAGPEHRNVQGW
mmetsp:Transcript_8200/g.14027  ORF Transcript_8200/g.14027 Transcript_8200/m.14027 type:complete len:109 (-) Transcript_8200:437-763(-)